MKRRFRLLLGLILYILLLGILMQFNWMEILRPIPLISVVAGIFILTLSQYKKGMTKEDVLSLAQWNAFFAGLLISLLSVLPVVSSELYSLDIKLLAENLIPLIYGSIFYLIIDLYHKQNEDSSVSEKDRDSNSIINAFTPHVANPILLSKGFSSRECHVALKMMEGISNKEIAQQLFITESTVKKHIQNMFKKCDATDRHSFISLYLAWVNESQSD
ncbi:MAG: LuxR family transcriptional regulator [Clostridiaceae bacterium]|nr:LuxR family transcriptional regulator [Clostridiaceae bacterium]